MNYKSIVYVLGNVMAITGLFMLLPVLIGLCYGELHDLPAFLACAAGALLAGLLLTRTKLKFTFFSSKDG